MYDIWSLNENTSICVSVLCSVFVTDISRNMKWILNEGKVERYCPIGWVAITKAPINIISEFDVCSVQ